MIVSCTQENLLKGLQIVGRSVGVRSTLPVLNNILIKTEKGGLKLSATDLEVGLSSWIGAKVDEEGALTIPAKLLLDFVANCQDKKIDLTQKDLSLNLKSEHFRANIKGIDAAEFPLIPKINKDKEIIVDAPSFSAALAKTLIAVALDESRPVLAGVYFYAKGNTLKMAATDSYRLAEQKINLDKKIEGEISFIVPGRPLAEMMRILSAGADKVSICPGENQVEFIMGETTLVSRLINGSFPDYQQIIPDKSTTQVSVNKNEFVAALKMAEIFARDNANNVKFKFSSPNKITILAVSASLGDNTAEVAGEVEGEEIEISFNAKFILDCLSVLSSEKIKLDLSGGTSAAQILGDKDANYLHLIMPLRTDE